MDRERLGEDEWVAFDGSDNGVSNFWKVQGNLVGDGSDEGVDIAARWIVPGEKETCEQNHLLLAHFGDSLCDRRLPGSGGTIYPHNKRIQISFPLNPFHDLGENGHTRFWMTFGGIETFL